MEKILLTTHVIISILLIFIVIVQGKDEGLSAAIGGQQSFQATKRGPEKVIFRITIILAALFLINALLFIFV